jgi:hypothetical protein
LDDMSALAGRPSPVETRSGADLVMRRLLRVPDAGRSPARTEAAQRLFSASILLSALRCLLGYVVFPIVSPALGAAAGVGPAVGIPLGLLALVFDVRGIRRFWLADHRRRWPITALYVVVMVLVTILLVRDVLHLT